MTAKKKCPLEAGTLIELGEHEGRKVAMRFRSRPKARELWTVIVDFGESARHPRKYAIDLAARWLGKSADEIEKLVPRLDGPAF